MPEYPYTKQELKDQFGWTFQQIKTRLKYLEVLLSDHYQGKKGVQYRFDEKVLAIFRRLNGLEGQGYDIKNASKQIITEIEKPQEKGNLGDIKTSEGSSKYTKSLEERVEELKTDKERLQKKVDSLEQRLLPPKKSDSAFQRFRQWLGL